MSLLFYCRNLTDKSLTSAKLFEEKATFLDGIGAIKDDWSCQSKKEKAQQTKDLETKKKLKGNFCDDDQKNAQKLFFEFS